MNLEKNNIDAQIELMKDILSNYNHIIYHVMETGKTINSLLSKRVEEKDRYVISKDKFDEAVKLISFLQVESRFVHLGILAEKAVPDNETKIKILKLLQKCQ